MNQFGHLVLLSVICLGSCCRDGWLTHAGKCYHFSREQEPWMLAVEMCKILKGQLLEIDNASENTYIQGQANVQGDGHRSYWIALSDLEEETTWVWMNTERRIAVGSFTDWAPGQPSNSGISQDCASLLASQRYQWNDDHCENKNYYICEMDDSGNEIVG